MYDRAASQDAKIRQKHREDMFLRRLFAMLSNMAKADGKIDELEVHAATKAFIYFPRAGERRRFCVRVFNEAKNGRISLFRLAWEFANKWAAPDDCVCAYELLWDIACANGVLKPVHKSNLKGICQYLNLPEHCFELCYRKRMGSFREWTHDEAQSEWKARWKKAEEERFEEYRRRAAAWENDDRRYGNGETGYDDGFQSEYEKRIRDWYRQSFDDVPPKRKPLSPLQKEYELIGCESDATDETLLRAYRAAAKKYHPDLLRANGYSESLIQKATAKMSQINDAWSKIRKERNI